MLSRMVIPATDTSTTTSFSMRALEPVSLDLRFEARPEFAGRLRKRLRTWLVEAGAAGDEILEILIATSEAFGNAVEHPRRRSQDWIDVEGRLFDDTLVVTVRDHGVWQDERLRPGGNGFRLMRAFMDAVEVDARSDGTAITMRRRVTAH